MTKEFDKKHGECHACKRQTSVTYLKTAHVPLYGWVCEDCREDWVLG
jgi:hypothetical protein